MHNWTNQQVCFEINAVEVYGLLYIQKSERANF